MEVSLSKLSDKLENKIKISSGPSGFCVIYPKQYFKC